MEFVVPALAQVLAMLGLLDIGLLRTLLIVVLTLAVWIGLLENLRSGSELGVQHAELKLVVGVWVLYAVLMFLAIYVNSRSLKDDFLVYLPGQLLFLYFISAPKVREKWIVGGMVALGVAQAGLALLQYAATPVFDGLFAGLLGQSSASNYHFAIGRLTGLWSDSVRLGVVLAMCYPFALLWAREKRSPWRYLAVGLIVTVTLLTFTRVAIMSLVVTTILMLWNSRKAVFARTLPALLALVVLLIVVQALPIGQQLERLYSPKSYQSEYATSAETYNRAAVLEALLPYVFKAPLFGIGISYRDYLSSGFTSAHNSLMQSALLFGIPVTVLLLILVGMVVVSLWRVVRRPEAVFALAGLLSALAVVVAGTTHGVAFDAPINMLFWMMAGLGLRQAIEASAADVDVVSE